MVTRLGGVNWYSWYRRVVADRALVLGVLGGTVTSLAGIVGYVFVPYLTGDAPDVVEAAVQAATSFTGFSAVYHAVVLVIPPFLLALGGILSLRRRGVTGRWNDAKALGGIVAGPVLTVLLGYVLTSIGVGLTFGSGTLLDPSNALLAVVYTYWALLFGLIFLMFILPGVLLAEGVSAVLGYLCATLVVRYGDHSQDGGATAGVADEPPSRD